MSLKEEIKNNFSEMQAEIRAFVDANIKYFQLLGFKISAKAFGLLLKISAITLMCALGLLFLSFSLAFMIGHELQSNTLGFLIVAGVYFFMALMVYVLRETLIELPILKKLSAIFFNN